MDVAVARVLGQQEVAGEHQEIGGGQQVAVQRRAVRAGAGHHRDHAEKRDAGEDDVGAGPALTEQPCRHQQDQCRLQRGNECGVDDRRLLERCEPEDEAQREADRRGERAPQQRNIDPTAGEIRDHDRDGDREQHPPEDDRRDRGVNPLHEERTETPREHREHDREQRHSGPPVLGGHGRTLPESLI